MNFKDRPFAIVDIETSGDDELKHEILEIGLLVVRQKDWEVMDSGNWLIKPHHIGNAVFTSFNVTFDWSFIKNVFRITGAQNLMDYHRLDILTLAWAMGGDKLEKFNLKAVSEFFGVPPEPDPHRAINGAETALAVLRKIKK